MRMCIIILKYFSLFHSIPKKCCLIVSSDLWFFENQGHIPDPYTQQMFIHKRGHKPANTGSPQHHSILAVFNTSYIIFVKMLNFSPQKINNNKKI